jgi:integrase
MKGRRQRGSVVSKGGLYFAVFRDGQGKQQWVGEKPGQGFQSAAAARRRLNEILVEIDRGSYIKPKTGTFAQFAEEWLAGRLSIEGGTTSAYGSIIRQHLIPAFGDLEVSEIDFPRAQAFAAALKQKISPSTGKQIASKTLHNVMTLLNTMMGGKFGNSAIKSGYVRQNPAAGVELPKRSGKEVIPPTAEQVSMLVAAAREIGGIGYTILLLEVSTGMRRGEMLAIRYSDVDWLNSEILIRRAVKKAEAADGVRKWKWILSSPKSPKSRRRIGLTETARQLLAGLRKVNAENGEGLVFTKGMIGLQPADAWIDPDYFDSTIFAPITEQAGLAGLRFHDLRHFFSSVLIAQGESAKYIQDQMGHSSIQVTFDLYGHLFPQARQDAVRKLDATLSAALSNKSLGSEKGAGVEQKRRNPNEVLESLLETEPSAAPKTPSRGRAN